MSFDIFSDFRMCWMDELYSKFSHEFHLIRDKKDHFIHKLRDQFENYETIKKIYENRLSDFKKTIDTYVKYLILDESNELNKEHFIGRSYP
jgi:hypothetical protein